MKRGLVFASLISILAFIGLTVAFSGGHEVGYSGGEWTIYLGCPNWLFISGYDGYPGFWKGFGKGEWGVSFPRLFCALAMAFMPLQLYILAYLALKRRLRVHLLTAIALQVVCAVLIWANVNVDPIWNIKRWGWPLQISDSPSEWGIFITANVCIAFISLFITAVLFEWGHNYYYYGAIQAKKPVSIGSEEKNVTGGR